MAGMIHDHAVRVPLSTLVPDPRNARLHGPANERAVRESLERFGQTSPLIVRRGSNVVLAGNLRLSVMRELGWSEALAVFLELSDEEAASIALADNRTAELATWDAAVLVELIGEVPEEALIGWTPEEVASLVEYVEPLVEPVAEESPETDSRGDDDDGSGLRAPFPWFGGKMRVAGSVWKRFGDVRNYVEPFFGSGAVLLHRPLDPGRVETVNDLDADVVNFWRAVKFDPEGVADAADWPVSELCIQARGTSLFYGADRAEFVEKMRADPEFFDAKKAGWWVHGRSAWIGSGWGARDGADAVHEKRPHLSKGRGEGIIARQRPHLSKGKGEGIIAVANQRPMLAGEGAGAGIHAKSSRENILETMLALRDRLRFVRMLCGDWSRVCTNSVTTLHGLTAVFLDPPYAVEDRDDCYSLDSRTVAKEVRAWAVEHGRNPEMRIAYCGYDEEMDDLRAAGWDEFAWKATGGYAASAKSGKRAGNAAKERIMFSPHCLRIDGRAR